MLNHYNSDILVQCSWLLFNFLNHSSFLKIKGKKNIIVRNIKLQADSYWGQKLEESLFNVTVLLWPCPLEELQ